MIKDFIYQKKEMIKFYFKHLREIFNLINNGIKIYNYYASKEVLFDNIYFKYDDFIPSKNDIVLDIGSQYGDYAIACVKLYNVKHVYAFEPLISNYHRAFNNIEYSKAYKDITLFPNGIRYNRNSEAFVKGNMISNINGDKISAGFVRLDDIDVFDNINILKIDVEGFEMEVLNSGIELIKKYKPKIIVETHSMQLHLEVRKFLTSLDYKLIHTDYNGSNKYMNYIANNFYN